MSLSLEHRRLLPRGVDSAIAAATPAYGKSPIFLKGRGSTVAPEVASWTRSSLRRRMSPSLDRQVPHTVNVWGSPYLCIHQVCISPQNRVNTSTITSNGGGDHVLLFPSVKWPEKWRPTPTTNLAVLMLRYRLQKCPQLEERGKSEVDNIPRPHPPARCPKLHLPTPRRSRVTPSFPPVVWARW